MRDALVRDRFSIALQFQARYTELHSQLTKKLKPEVGIRQEDRQTDRRAEEKKEGGEQRME